MNIFVSWRLCVNRLCYYNSATKDILSVGTVSKASETAWATILSLDHKLRLLLQFSQHRILLLRWSSLHTSLRRHLNPKQLRILRLLLATCPPLLSHSRRLYHLNSLPHRRLNRVNSTTARPLILRWRGIATLEIWPAYSMRQMSPMAGYKPLRMRLV